MYQGNILGVERVSDRQLWVEDNWSATVAEKQHYIQNNLEKQEKIEETKKEFNKKNLSVDDMKNEFDKLFAN